MRIEASRRSRLFLEHMQAAAYEHLGMEPRDNGRLNDIPDSALLELVLSWYPEASEEHIREGKAGLAEARKLIAQGVPTRYENPMDYFILHRTWQDLCDVARTFGLEYNVPLLGTMPTGQLNALTVPIPGTSDHIILVEDELLEFTFRASSIVFRAFPFTGVDSDGHGAFSVDYDRIKRQVASDRTIVDRFLDTTMIYSTTGSLPRRVDQLSDIWVDRGQTSLATSMQAFVMGHELAHIIRGHTRDAETEPVARLNGIDTVSYSWKREIEADVVGVVLAMKALEGKADLSVSFWGADFLFAAMDTMDRLISTLTYGRERKRSLGSHPPPEMRRQAVRDALVSLVGEESARAPIDLADSVTYAVNLLWNKARPRVRQMHSLGSRPATKWRNFEKVIEA